MEIRRFLSRKWLKPLVAFKFFPLFLWGFIGLIILTIGLNSNNIQTIAERMELALLDQRIRYRASHLTPSDQIVVVALDKSTDEYVGRHPEIGITGRILPRKQLARIFQYLTDQGVKAIAVDVELTWPQSEDNDAPLEQVIQQAGNIYLSSPVSLKMKDFLAQQNTTDQGRVITNFRHAIFSEYFFPFLKTQARLFQKMGPGCQMGYNTLGLEQPYSIVEFTMPLSPGNLRDIWSSLCRTQMPPDTLLYRPSSPQQVMFSAENNPLVEGYGKICLQKMYQAMYSDQPKYLDLISRSAIPFYFQELPTLEAENNFSYCWINPLETRFIQHAKGFGISSIDYDEDAYLRKVPVFYKSYNGQFFSMLPISPVLDILGNPPFRYTPQSLYLGERQINLVDGRNVIVNWRNPALLVKKQFEEAGLPLSYEEFSSIRSDTANSQLGYGHLYRFISVKDILVKMDSPNNFTPSLYRIPGVPESGMLSLKGKIVIYGETVKDIHRTPMGSITYGPEYMATVMDMFLHDQKFVQKSPFLLTLAIVLAVSCFIVYSVVFIPRLYLGLIAGLAGAILFWLYNFMIFDLEALWIPLIWPTLFFGFSLMGGLVYRYYIQDREKRLLTNIFSKYVSPQLMDQILDNPNTAMSDLNGARKELTVLFSDIHNFTPQFENAEPELIVQQLNEYFNAMTKAVLRNGGTYDKYMGDALMAFFGAPTAMPNHAEMACRAALEMQLALDELNQKWAKEGKPQLKHGIGISTGTMFVGNFGSDDIKNFTVMGSSVNLGSRLETLTRHVDADIIISENTYLSVQEWSEVRDLGKTNIKGFSEPIQIYGLDGLQSAKSSKALNKTAR